MVTLAPAACSAARPAVNAAVIAPASPPVARPPKAAVTIVLNIVPALLSAAASKADHAPLTTVTSSAPNEDEFVIHDSTAAISASTVAKKLVILFS